MKTLVITDIDGTKPVKKGKRTHYKACPSSEAVRSSNTGINKWFDTSRDILFTKIKSKTAEQKLSGCRRIAYQTPESGQTGCGRSFEDAFVFANQTMFNLSGSTSLEIEENAMMLAKEEAKDGKANFAIKYSVDKTDWVVPEYISEGLEWLDSDSATKAAEELVWQI